MGYRSKSIITIAFFTITIACLAYGKQYTEAQEKPETASVEALEQRVTAYWKAIEAGDLVKAYDYEEFKARGELSLQQYVRRGTRIFFKRVNLVDVKIDENNVGVATLDSESVVQGLPGTIKGEFKDHWVLIDGVWYHSVRLNKAAKRNKQ